MLLKKVRDVLLSKTALTLAFGLAIILFLAFGPIKQAPQQLSPVETRNYFRLFSPAEYDIVLLGNSRVGAGLSPTYMNQLIPDANILNFAFPGIGYKSDYMDKAITRLNQNSSNKIVVLGFAPSMMIRVAISRINIFDEMLARFSASPLADFLSNFQPLPQFNVKQYLPDQENDNKQFKDRGPQNGWAPLKRSRDHNIAYEYYRNSVFDGDQVLPSVCSLVLDKVKSWSDQGITVVGLRVPATDIMWSIEDELSGLDFEMFAQQFSRAGGNWIDFTNVYDSAEGNHLSIEGAEKLSLDLAKAIKNIQDK
jgi:hypothetical protein